MIKDKILNIRNKQVILDRDLAELYEVTTKRLNEQVKRNIDRFPADFMFKLTNEDKNDLVAKCDHLDSLKYSYHNPYAFTEHGVAALSGVLKSKKAIEVNLQIIRAFVSMRKLISKNIKLFSRINNIESKLLKHDSKFEKVFKALELEKPKQGIFFDGQIFDAYKFISDLIKTAKKEIILIDNYVDENTLFLFSKTKVKVTIYTKKIPKKDLEKYNLQYDNLSIKEFDRSHDRFLIIDGETYLIGASLKDLGKKWFGFFKFDDIEFKSRLKSIEEARKRLGL